MNKLSIYLLIRWLFIILVQVLVLNQIELHQLINPYIYPLFILLLPLETPIWAVLLMSFGTGLVVDIFNNSLGLHTAATVFMGYVRNNVINLKKNNQEYAADKSDNSLNSMNLREFFSYALICIAAHHFVYFFLEMFSLSHLGYFALKTISSIAMSMAIIMLSRYLFSYR